MTQLGSKSAAGWRTRPPRAGRSPEGRPTKKQQGDANYLSSSLTP